MPAPKLGSDMIDALLSIREISKVLSVPRSSLDRWRLTGEFPPPSVVLPEDEERWSESDLEEWLETRRPSVSPTVTKATGDDVSPSLTVTKPSPTVTKPSPTVTSPVTNCHQNELVTEEFPPMSPDAEEVFKVLRKARGEWVSREEAIEESGVSGGSIDRAVGILKRRGMIESNQARGYRVRPEYRPSG